VRGEGRDIHHPSLSVCLSLSLDWHTHALSLTLSLLFTDTHTHSLSTQTHPPSPYIHTQTHIPSLSSLYTQTHTLTHTIAHTARNWFPGVQLQSANDVLSGGHSRAKRMEKEYVSVCVYREREGESV